MAQARVLVSAAHTLPDKTALTESQVTRKTAIIAAAPPKRIHTILAIAPQRTPESPALSRDHDDDAGHSKGNDDSIVMVWSATQTIQEPGR